MIELDKIYNEDCLEGMKMIPDGTVDLVVTDCPYHIDCGGNRKNEGQSRPMGGMFNRDNPKLSKIIATGKIFADNDITFSQWLPDVFRVLKERSHCYIMVNARNLTELQNEAEKVGFKFQQLLVWDKGNATPNRFYMNSAEFILMLKKGGYRTINNPSMKNILRVPNVIKEKLHPTGKPVDLMSILVKNSSNEGDTILDPFMGSGTTAIACHREKRHFIGFELNKEYYDKALKRIKLEQAQLTLF